MRMTSKTWNIGGPVREIPKLDSDRRLLTSNFPLSYY